MTINRSKKWSNNLFFLFIRIELLTTISGSSHDLKKLCPYSSYDQSANSSVLRDLKISLLHFFTDYPVLSSQKCMNLGQFCLLCGKKSKLKPFSRFLYSKNHFHDASCTKQSSYAELKKPKISRLLTKIF